MIEKANVKTNICAVLSSELQRSISENDIIYDLSDANGADTADDLSDFDL